jgi:uncharacterized protein YjdB
MKRAIYTFLLGLSAVFFNTTQVQAAIVYTDIPDGVPMGIDFNQDGSDEFTVDQWGMMNPGDYIDYWAAGADNNIHALGTMAADWDVPECVAAGYTIDASGNWIGAGDCAINGWGGTNSSITPGVDTYIAMTFNLTGLGSNIYYGWVRINVAANGDVTYKDYAYNDTPGTAINAGDMGSTNVPVTSITVQGQGGATTVASTGTLQMLEAVLPANATDPSVSWSVTNGTGTATISASGLLTGGAAGTVTVVATANDGSTVTGSTVITITSTNIPVNSISVQGQGGATTVATAGTLQMVESVLPANATDPSVTWSVTNGTGTATISASGLLTGTTAGTVTVVATANDGTAVTGSAVITVTSTNIPVNTITVQGQGGATTVASGGTLQMIESVLPANATDPSVTWSVTNGTGTATISASGLLTGGTGGTVTVVASANDGSGVTGSTVITVTTSTTIPVSSITVQGQGGVTSVISAGGTLQMTAAVLPANATDPSVTWSVMNGTGTATISGLGILSGGNPGTVTVVATANDGSGVTGTAQITVDPIMVNFINVTGQGGTTTANLGSTLQMVATVLPSNATNQNVTWSVNNTSVATIDQNGVLTPVSNGLVMVIATATDGTGVTGQVLMNVPPILVQSINVTGTGGATSISTAGGTLQMIATILPANASDQSVTWSVDDASIATISAGGLLTGVSDGQVEVTATANDGTGISGMTTITVVNQTQVSILENNTISIDLYPNPATDVVYVNGEDITELIVYNLQGAVVFSDANFSGVSMLSVNSWESGVYFIHVKTTHGWTQKRLFVQ